MFPSGKRLILSYELLVRGKAKERCGEARQEAMRGGRGEGVMEHRN